jgi:hypothetical protein
MSWRYTLSFNKVVYRRTNMSFAGQSLFLHVPAFPLMSFRKAALCYIQSQHFTKVQDILRPCPQDQAATQYLNFMAALYQNKVEAGMTYQAA